MNVNLSLIADFLSLTGLCFHSAGSDDKARCRAYNTTGNCLQISSTFAFSYHSYYQHFPSLFSFQAQEKASSAAETADTDGKETKKEETGDQIVCLIIDSNPQALHLMPMSRHQKLQFNFIISEEANGDKKKEAAVDKDNPKDENKEHKEEKKKDNDTTKTGG